MWQVQKRGLDESINSSNVSSSGRSDRSSLTYETFTALLESFEAKKKCVFRAVHLEPALTALQALYACHYKGLVNH